MCGREVAMVIFRLLSCECVGKKRYVQIYLRDNKFHGKHVR